MIFSANNCSGNVTSYYCDELPPSSSAQTVSASGLTPGNTYYIMIDGFAGDVCDYVFAANSGVATPVDVNPATSTICVGDNVVLTASGGNGTYTWGASPQLSGTTGTTVTATPPAVPGTYTYSVSSSGGNPLCPSSTTVNATITVENCGCSVTANNSGGVCANSGGTVDLTATTISGATYSWTGPNGFVSNAQNPTGVAVPTTAGTYNYTVEVNDNGSICTAVTTVTVYALPNANGGPSQTMSCTAGSVVLNGSSSTSGVTYSWSGPGVVSGGTTATPTVNQIGTYTLTVTETATGCTNTATTSVSNNAATPNANAGSQQELTCTAASTQLNGSSTTPGVNFSWSGPGIVSGGNTATPTVNQSGTYTLTVTDPANGCASSTTVDVVTNTTPPDAAANTAGTLTCTVLSTTLSGVSATPGATYSWSGPGIVSGAASATPTVDQAGNYTVTVTNPLNGCTASASTAVIANTTPPDVSLDPAGTLSCATTSISLSGSSTTPGAGYSWSGPGVVSGATGTSPTVNQTGVYTLTVTDPATGCTATGSVNVNGNLTPPSVAFSADTLIGCELLEVTFQESLNLPGMTYAWTFGDGGSASGSGTVSHTYTQTGCYDVQLTVTNTANGCSNSAIQTSYICIIDPPTASFTASPQVVHSFGDGLVQFSNNSVNATNYTWDFGDGIPVTSTHTSYDYSGGEGAYTVVLIASNQGMCFDTTSLVITAEQEVIYYVPNTFTPDGDSYNQTFRPIITEGIDIYKFTFIIYNRWGEMIWESHDPAVGWNGLYGGTPAQDGIYVWTMKLKVEREDNYIEHTGHVNLMR